MYIYIHNLMYIQLYIIITYIYVYTLTVIVFVHMAMAEAGDSGGSILHIKPASYLSMPLEGLAPGGAGSGEASPRGEMATRFWYKKIDMFVENV